MFEKLGVMGRENTSQGICYTNYFQEMKKRKAECSARISKTSCILRKVFKLAKRPLVRPFYTMVNFPIGVISNPAPKSSYSDLWR